MDISGIDTSGFITFTEEAKKERKSPVNPLSIHAEVCGNLLFPDENFLVNFWSYGVHHALRWFNNISEFPERSIVPEKRKFTSSTPFSKSPSNIAYGLVATFTMLKRGGALIFTGSQFYINKLEHEMRKFKPGDISPERFGDAICNTFASMSDSELEQYVKWYTLQRADREEIASVKKHLVHEVVCQWGLHE